MKLAVVGSVALAGNTEAYRLILFLYDLLQPSLVISGGADGIDTMAVDIAKLRDIPHLEFKPTVRQWGGPGGFKERNIQIATECDRLVRIYLMNSTTYGSGFTRDYARRLGKPTAAWGI